MDRKNEHERAHILASGRVQGVGFRWTVKRVADESGVVGTVRNLRDGSVEVWAEAAQDVLVQFIGAVFRGTPAGEVRNLSVEWDFGCGDWSSFEIVS